MRDIGKTPVRGNGPISIQQLQEDYATRRRTSDVPLSVGNDASGPPPVAPGRAETPSPLDIALSSHSGSNSRPASLSVKESVISPQLSFRKRGESLQPQQDELVDSSNKSYRNAVGHQSSADFMSRDRAMSIQTSATGSSKYHVDILDAQSEFMPTKFYSRIEAAGVRDYGEDVADRNMVENGIEVTSPSTSAFHNSPDESAPAPVVARNAYRDKHLSQKPRWLRSRREYRLQRTRSLLLHMSNRPLSAQGYSTESVGVQRSATGARRAMSLASYMPTPQNRYRNERLTMASHAPDIEFLNVLAAQMRPSTTWERDVLSSREKPASSVAETALKRLPGGSETKPKPRQPRRTSEAKSTVSNGSAHPISDNASPQANRLIVTAPTVLARGSRMLPLVCTPAGQERRASASTSTGECGKADDEGSVSFESPENMDDGDDGACPPPDIQGGVRRPARTVSHGSFSRTRASLRSSLATTEKMEEMIYEQMPQQNSNIHKLSVGSETTPPTTISSITSLRPESADGLTTIDSALTSQGLSEKVKTDIKHKISLSEVDATLQSKSAHTVMSVHVHPPPLTTVSNFNMDDYISSDDDENESDGPRRPRGEGEEELLFRDTGYGIMQLPGLFDSIDQSGGARIANLTPVCGSGERNTPQEVEHQEQLTRCNMRMTETEYSSTIDNPTSQASGSSPLLSQIVHALMGQGSRTTSYSGSLRHAASAPAVRGLASFTGSYSSSEYAEDDAEKCESSASSALPQIAPCRHNISAVVRPQTSRHVSEKSGLRSHQSDSQSNTSEYCRCNREEFDQVMRTRQHQYAPSALRHQHGPVPQIPIPIKPPTPDTRKPVLPPHQQDAENEILPVRQIQMPVPTRPQAPCVGHALQSLRYSPVTLSSSSSEYLNDECEAGMTLDVPHSRRGSGDSAQASEETPSHQGYAYGHGGAKYGNGYGFIKIRPEIGGTDSVPGTPAEEKDGFLVAKGKKLVRQKLVRSDNREINVRKRF